MARKPTDSTISATLGFEPDIHSFNIRHSAFGLSAAIPSHLFDSTQIPVCLWFLAKNKNADPKPRFRDRHKQTLFIEACKLGTLIARVHRELNDADLEKITALYHASRSEIGPGRFWNGIFGVGLAALLV
jgi:type I restriction enzyme M protein